MPGIKPTLYAGNLECSAESPRALVGAARLTAWYVRAASQDVSPGKCVLLSTSEAVRKSVKLWDVSGDGLPGKVKLDVQDLGGHLDFTRRARADTPASSLGSFRATIVRSVWSSRMPLAGSPVILGPLDGSVGVDPAHCIVIARFQMMHRYFAYCPDEVPRIFRMLGLIAHGADGHGPVHLLLISAAEIGFVWDGSEQGWVRAALPHLRMLVGPVQHFESAIL